MDITCQSCRAGLTAPEAILLAEDALKAGRLRTAECYVTVAYAILDANVARNNALARSARGDTAGH